MNFFKKLRNYLLYCGIEKEEYKEIKKDAYISNFEIWRFLHCLMTVIFIFLYVASLGIEMMEANRIFYLIVLIYSAVVSILFLFVLKKDSIIAQLVIYLSISILFLFGAFITKAKPENPSTTFIALLILAPMFMIDKPYFMALVLAIASTVYLVWMSYVKTPEVWQLDLGNIIVFAIVGLFIHIIANSIRIKEFVLTRKINIQKDIDELTTLKNKAALTKEINEYLMDESKNKGILFVLDINYFKSVNDTYGHDVGDSVIHQLGLYLHNSFKRDEIVGRFGGDEFIIFIKDTDEIAIAKLTANSIIDGSTNYIKLPDEDKKITVSIGIAIYHGEEKNYSEIFKKADVALYKTKADRSLRYQIYGEE